MNIRDYVIRRLIFTIFIIIGITLITFILMHALPVDLAAMYAGNPRDNPATEINEAEMMLKAAREKFGLDKPLWVQYGYYLYNLFIKFDMGISMRTHKPVGEEILNRLPATLELIFVSILIAFLAGVAVGVISAKKQNKFTDHIMRIISISGVSLPAFWLAILLQFIFGSLLGWFPISGRYDPQLFHQYPFHSITGFYLIDTLIQGNFRMFGDVAWHLILPAIAMASYPFGAIARMTRAALLEVMDEQYIDSARAMGLPKKIITKYALKNAMGPTLTITGLNFAYMLTGAFYVEWIFGWGGIGWFAGMALLNLDYTVIMGMVVVVSLFYVIVNLIVDIIQVYIDPRISLGEKA